MPHVGAENGGGTRKGERERGEYETVRRIGGEKRKENEEGKGVGNGGRTRKGKREKGEYERVRRIGREERN